MKSYFNNGQEAPLYFWRDTKNHEVDLVVDHGEWLEPIEIKSSATFAPSFVDGLAYFAKLQNRPGGEVIYAGAETFAFKDYNLTNWRAL